MNANSISKSSIGEKVVRCRFFFVECSVGVEAGSGSLSQSLLELVMLRSPEFGFVLIIFSVAGKY